ncbi:MAG TPA: hypothetical protein VHC22_16055 [Pirellulales bacterium]|nr:hypothetical protein [Pirellulales bacterium]
MGVWLSAATGSGQDVTVQGNVMGAQAGCQVVLSGPVSANLSTDGSGNFSYTGAATSLGTVTAMVSDNNGDCCQAETSIQDSAPNIESLTIVPTGVGKQVDISGTVEAGCMNDLTVKFSGTVGLAANSATTDSSGCFNLQTTAAALGSVSAVATDVWGVSSFTVNAMLMVMTPQIQSLNATEVGNGEWQFSGTVTGPNVSDDSVQLSGLGSATATPNSAGYFSVTVSLNSNNPMGSEFAVATDAWNQSSNQAFYMFMF